MTAYQLFRGLTGVDGELLAAAELVDSRKESATKKLPARKIWLVAAVIALALLLVGCAVAYALTVFGSPAEMIAGLYGGADSAAPFEDSDPDRPNAAWTVPGYEKSPVEETVAQELQMWVSPVG